MTFTDANKYLGMYTFQKYGKILKLQAPSGPKASRIREVLCVYNVLAPERVW